MASTMQRAVDRDTIHSSAAHHGYDDQSENDEPLPFALDTEDQSGHKLAASAQPPAVVTPHKLCQSQQLPPLASSLVSSPAESQLSSSQHTTTTADPFASSSLSQVDSRYLDAAASLLLPNSSITNIVPTTGTSTPPTSATSSSMLQSHGRNSLETVSLSATTETVGFSQLLSRAEAFEARSTARLPVLHEDAVTHNTRASSNHRISPPTSPYGSSSAAAASSSSLLQSQVTILAGASSIMQTNRRMASLAGASAQQTGANAVQVAIELSGVTMEQTMDILSNPSMLPLWYDAIPSSLVVMQGGTRRNEQGRAYDAEWIEATTTHLVPPTSTCILSLKRALESSLGFPTFGKVSMFVEREQCRVGMTVGPFDGGITVSHRLAASQSGNNKVRIVNDMQVQGGSWLSPVLPSLNNYLDQALSSTARLRFLVENGEAQAPSYSPPPDDLSAPLL